MKKRRMIFIPEVNPKSFVFFFERGNSGTSWSIRDYSIRSCVRERGPRDFHWTTDEIHLKAQYSFDAPTVSTDDLAFWHKQTEELNNRYLGNPAPTPTVVEAPPARLAAAADQPAPVTKGDAIPILNLPQLLGLPKGRKTQDMERILHSRNSEDWVTWSFFQILLKQYPSGWWGHLVSAARRRNPELDFPFDERSLPTLKLWELVRSPSQYEAQSRARMLASGNPEWIGRAQSPDPVEGSSEIDIAFEHNQFLVFVEAKLGSDVSPSTSYDPGRNQIIRNIDCLIEKAGGKTAIFWMFARDEEPSRAYVQLMNGYKSDPGLLARDLPHRNAAALEKIAQNLTILLWSDFCELVCSPGVDPEANAVKKELERRILVR
jgi:hypothetical protein